MESDGERAAQARSRTAWESMAAGWEAKCRHNLKHRGEVAGEDGIAAACTTGETVIREQWPFHGSVHFDKIAASIRGLCAASRGRRQAKHSLGLYDERSFSMVRRWRAFLHGAMTFLLAGWLPTSACTNLLGEC